MNDILTKVKKIMEENIKAYLSDVTFEQLEHAAAIFYMNGNNGTEFDWHVNGRLSYFMVFYNEDENLGAAKLGIHKNGDAELFLYGDKGHKLVKELAFKIEADVQSLLKLAVALKMVADETQKWDSNISDFDLDFEISEDAVVEFQNNVEFYVETIARRELLSMTAVVSKKILEEGWKVGIMTRSKPSRKTDSGWYFGAGNESEEYLDNAENFALVYVGYIWNEIDSDIIKYITSSVETQLIRVSPTGFEIDDCKSEIYCEKRS